MSIPGRDSTAAMLVRTGFVVAPQPVNVPGFCPVLAREWHGAASVRRCLVLNLRSIASRYPLRFGVWTMYGQRSN
jgi:hypothetical protein